MQFLQFVVGTVDVALKPRHSDRLPRNVELKILPRVGGTAFLIKCKPTTTHHPKTVGLRLRTTEIYVNCVRNAIGGYRGSSRSADLLVLRHGEHLLAGHGSGRPDRVGDQNSQLKLRLSLPLQMVGDHYLLPRFPTSR